MTNSTFAFLSGRSHAEEVTTSAGRRRSPGALQAVRRRIAAKRFTAAQRRHQHRDTTDAYLDRGGMSSVDWLDGLGHYAHR